MGLYQKHKYDIKTLHILLKNWR